VVSQLNDSSVNSSNAMRAAHAVAPNLAPQSEERLPVRGIKPLAHSELLLMQYRAELDLGRALRSHVLELCWIYNLYAGHGAFLVTSCLGDNANSPRESRLLPACGWSDLSVLVKW